MGFLKKTILLKNNQKGLTYGMGVVTIEKNNSGVFGSIKSYDMNVSGKLKMGISVDGVDVAKYDLNFADDNTYNFKLKNEFNINGNIGCVVVSVNNDSVTPIIWGSNKSGATYKEDIITFFQKDYQSKTRLENSYSSSVKTVHNKYETDHKNQVYSEQGLNYVNSNIQQMANNPQITKLFESSEEEINKLIEEELKDFDNEDFFSLISEQIDELFKNYPMEEKLNNLIPNSKWVRVDYDNNGREYVVGLIYEDEKIKYVCYGVPGTFDKEPPSELINYSQWVPLDVNMPELNGYWVMFQDANTGDSVEIKEDLA